MEYRGREGSEGGNIAQSCQEFTLEPDGFIFCLALSLCSQLGIGLSQVIFQPVHMSMGIQLEEKGQSYDAE